ncbi:MAG: hypothetical protein ACYSU3_09800 [Planctomycetota bacterium]
MQSDFLTSDRELVLLASLYSCLKPANSIGLAEPQAQRRSAS